MIVIRNWGGGYKQGSAEWWTIQEPGDWRCRVAREEFTGSGRRGSVLTLDCAASACAHATRSHTTDGKNGRLPKDERGPSFNGTIERKARSLAQTILKSEQENEALRQQVPAAAKS
jgi:hypothetical protein